MRLPSHLPLFWTICLINGLVLWWAALVLVLSPARVSPTRCRSEFLVHQLGLAVDDADQRPPCPVGARPAAPDDHSA